ACGRRRSPRGTARRPRSLRRCARHDATLVGADVRTCGLCPCVRLRCAPRALSGGLRMSALETYGSEAKERVGFFTDTSVCIGCKACEVACKEWNVIPQHGVEWSGNSYDNTQQLGPEAWRHVAFIEQRAPVRLDGDQAELNGDSLRWLMSSDVCKHCTHAACLDVCPTGALFRTELGTVVVQEDICNGCGYCVPACPFGVIDRRELPTSERPGPFAGKPDGRVWKCTLCYDRTKGGHEPACAKACPTD